MITVVKLGGSLLAADALLACLQAAIRLPGRIVTVTGGGVFADLIREQQHILGFTDITAHRMAILAMQQTALFCHGLLPQLTLCTSVGELMTESDHALWLPDWRELDNAGVPANWAITSDSLAAWLAEKLGAERLILVKAAPVDPALDLPQLLSQDLLDAAFLDFAQSMHGRISVFNHQHFLSFSCSS